MMKIFFYFILKALFALEIFKYLFWLFGHVGKQLDKNAKVNFKIRDVTSWVTTTAIHILPGISKIKGNQTMEFGQLIEYNMGNISLEKLCTKCGGETIPKPFFEISN